VSVPEPDLLDAEVDDVIASCLFSKPPTSFFLYAGAGSGKTRSLVKALSMLLEKRGAELRMRGQRICVITYTNKAVDEIKRRTEFNALVEVSTIHSFAWSLIQGYTNDIRSWLQSHLSDDIQKLHELQARGRRGSRAANEREVSIRTKSARLANLPNIQRFVYSPTENKRTRDSLAHSEVIGCVAALLQSKPMLQQILISRFPILLIDESQDTNRHLMDALLVVQRRHSCRFVMALFGDTMQRIYADGKIGLDAAIPVEWAKPAKKINHRSRARIVGLVNRIRSRVDHHLQQSRPDKDGGFVRLFIFPQTYSDKRRAEAFAASRMAELTGDKDWMRDGARQTLILEHHMAAARLGFEDLFSPLYEVESYRTGLLEGTLPPLRFLTAEVLPLVTASREDNHFAAMAVLRRFSPLLSEEALKGAGKEQASHMSAVKKYVNDLLALWKQGDPSVQSVLNAIGKSGLFQIAEQLIPLVEEVPTLPADDEAIVDDEKEEDDDAGMLAWREVADVPFSQVEAYARYTAGLSGFDTHQGVKGLEYQRVMVIIDDAAARGFMFSYEELFGTASTPEPWQRRAANAEETTADRTRRLLYVTCSRAEDSLALVAYTQNPVLLRDFVVRDGLFESAEVELPAL
jgi:DNA helicase II / ATP-dependent DNA helicase PcrA